MSTRFSRWYRTREAPFLLTLQAQRWSAGGRALRSALSARGAASAREIQTRPYFRSRVTKWQERGICPWACATNKTQSPIYLEFLMGLTPFPEELQGLPIAATLHL